MVEVAHVSASPFKRLSDIFQDIIDNHQADLSSSFELCSLKVETNLPEPLWRAGMTAVNHYFLPILTPCIVLEDDGRRMPSRKATLLCN